MNLIDEYNSIRLESLKKEIKKFRKNYLETDYQGRELEEQLNKLFNLELKERELFQRLEDAD